MRESTAPRRARILLVEDDPGDQELTQRALAQEWILADVHVASDGEEALDYLLHRGRYADPESAPRPDLILLDLNLPGMPGRRVLEAKRRHGELCQTPVVVVSTSARKSDVAESYALGCTSYVIKPLEARRYMKVLEDLYKYWFKLVALPTI